MKKLSSIIKPINFEEKPLDKETSEFVVLHNNLVEARYRLTLQEKRIVLWLASQVTPFDEDFKEHSLSIKDFSDLINTQGENLYTRLQSITRRLMQRIITIRPIGEKRLIQVAWLGAADYKIDKGIISLSFHPHLKPFFLQLKRNFTKINIVDVMGLKSIYSIRIYELLKQKEFVGMRIITIDEIRDYCGISKEKYKQINDLIRKVLEVSKLDINDKTDIEITYSMIKEGRKYVSVSFDVKNKKTIKKFSESLKNVKTKIKKCEICNNLTENDKCDICLDQSRSSDVLCVVENTKNLILFEKANVFNGKYHVLEGLISPLEGVNPEDIPSVIQTIKNMASGYV